MITNSEISNRATHKNTGAVNCLRHFIEGNYLYIISALFLMLGATMLRHSDALAVSEFWRTLQSLFVLQAYEFALILTSVAIVRHFKKLNDAFILFFILFILILDPTSFSNAFHTMYNQYGTLQQSLYINVGLALLAVLKFLIVCKGIGLMVSPRGWFSFITAMTFLYLGEFLLVRPDLILVPFYYTYLLAWLPFALTFISPLRKSYAEFQGDDDFASTLVRIRIDRMLLVLPPVALIAHYFQSAFIHRFPITSLHVAPAFIIIASLTMLVYRKTEHPNRLMPVIDGALFLALIFAFNGRTNNSFEIWQSINQPLGIAIITAAGISLYLRHYKSFLQKSALWRIAIWGGLGAVYLIFKMGIVSWIVKKMIVAISHGLDYFAEYFTFFVASIALYFFVNAILKKREWIVIAIWGFVLWLFSSFILTDLGIFAPSTMFALGLIFLSTISLIFKAPLNDQRLLLAFTVIYCSTRFTFSTNSETIIFFILTGIILSIAMLKNHHWSFYIIFLLHILIPILWWGRSQIATIPPAWLFVALGFTLFGFGIFITFKRQWLIGYLQKNLEHSNDSPSDGI